MYNAILKSLNIERRESGMVALLVLQTFFLGIFAVSFEISSTTLFMEQYGEELLGRGYLVSGLIGMVLTGLFSALQGRIRYSVLITFNLIMITILTFAMWASFEYTDSEWLVFGIFSLQTAIFILTIVAFSGMAGRLFTLRQGKRLFSIIDSGLVFGMILFPLAQPFILQNVPSIKDLMFIGASSMLLSFVFQSVIVLKYNVNRESSDETPEEVQSEEKERVGIRKFISDRYIRLMSLFQMLSMVALFFTAYNFLTSAKMSYPDPTDYAIFLGNFTIAVMIFSFALKTFVYSKLIKTYGLQVTLLITPVLIGILVLVSALVGTLLGYEEETANFVIFFLLLALVRFFSINLKDSIQTPSIRLLFQPIDSRIRYNVQAKVEGLVNEFSAVLSGLVLALLGLLSFMELIHYSYILIGVIALWSYIAVQLYKEYQNMLRRSLVEYKRKMRTVSAEEHAEDSSADSHSKESIEKIERSLNLMKEYEPTLFDLRLDNLLKDNSIKARELAIRSIDEAEIYGAIKELSKIAKEDKDQKIVKLASEVRDKLEKSFKGYLDQEKIIALARSKNTDDRVKAAKIIGDSGNHEYSSLLKNLLKDLSPRVKLQAINSIAKLDNKDLWPSLIEELGNEQYRAAAKTAIETVGEPILESLERAFYKSGVELELLVAIVELYGRIDGEKTVKYLLKKLNYPNRQIVSKALHSLKMLDFSAKDEGISSTIFQAIEQNVSLAAWNFSAKYDVEQQGLSKNLSEALQEELNDNYNMIFLLLSLVYDPSSIEHIRKNIESGTTEGVSFAIEMLDLFIADQLKGFLFALLEDNRDEEKIRELELHFPINVYGNSDVLKQIMNRSANFLSNFTRACAIYAFLNLEEEEQVIGNDIIANLFNNDPMLSQTSAIVMSAIDRKKYDDAKERLEEDQIDILDMAISEFKKNRYNALIEKVIFLNSVDVLQHRDQDLLEDMALQMTYGQLKSGSTLITNGNENAYYFLIEGSANCQLAEGKIEFGSSQIINDSFFFDSDVSALEVKVDTDSIFLKMSNEDFRALLFKYPVLGEIMLHSFDLRLNRKIGVS